MTTLILPQYTGNVDHRAKCYWSGNTTCGQHQEQIGQACSIFVRRTIPHENAERFTVENTLTKCAHHNPLNAKSKGFLAVWHAPRIISR